MRQRAGELQLPDGVLQTDTVRLHPEPRREAGIRDLLHELTATAERLCQCQTKQLVSPTEANDAAFALDIGRSEGIIAAVGVKEIQPRIASESERTTRRQ